MNFPCTVCKKAQPVQNFVQLIPCLHYLCKTCFDRLTKTQKVCPVKYCFSALRQQPDIRLNTCESPECSRAIAPYGDNYYLDCGHEVCPPCYDIIMRKKRPLCCVCGAMVVEDEEEACEQCLKTFLNDKMANAPCCQARLCQHCMLSNKNNNNKCAPKCPPAKKKRKRAQAKEASQAAAICAGTPDCKGEVLRNFPSDNECDHSVCQACLGKHLDECSNSGTVPCCPIESCRTVYRLDSVLALRVLYPEKATFFDQFNLEFHFGLEKLKDDTVQIINIDNQFVLKKKLLTIKVCIFDDEDNMSTITFDKEGSIGDLIRETRKELKIAVSDKVYGYYTKENGEELMLSVSSENATNSIDKFGIADKSLVMVDLSGAVARKRNSVGGPSDGLISPCDECLG